MPMAADVQRRFDFELCAASHQPVQTPQDDKRQAVHNPVHQFLEMHLLVGWIGLFPKLQQIRTKYYGSSVQNWNKIFERHLFSPAQLGKKASRMDMSEPTKQLFLVPGRFAQSSAADPIAQNEKTSAPKANPEPAEVPIGVLEVPLVVWGSRRAGSNLGQSELAEMFAEETCTVIVFPQGAVIRLSASVTPGQQIIVANRKSGQIILCRVANVRTYPHVRGYAEIEFMQLTTGFWGSYIPQGTLKLTEGIRR